MKAAREKLRLAVLISGRGSNMEAIAEACAQNLIDARIVRVIADRGTAAGIERARRLGLTGTVIEAAGYADRDRHEEALTDSIRSCGAELVVLAGYLRILSAAFVQRHAGRVLNIHPSLLPKYRGLHTHRRALEAGEREHGASVHFVSAELDGGPVICQARVPVLPGDTEESLAARVLIREHKIYPLVIGLIAAGRVRLKDERVWLDGHALTQPLTEDDPAIGLKRSDEA
jgi:phosphoribosylglycinamide formyltransferase-1